MSQSDQSQTQIKEENKELVLKLNEDYWKSRHNNNCMNSLGHYQNENTIKQTIERCFIDLSFNNCVELFELFKQNQVDFDARDYFEGTSLLFDYASFQSTTEQINNNYYDRMKLLLDYGADPDWHHNLKQHKKPTCLIKSIENKHRFQLLLDYGADPLFIPDQQFNTIVDYINDIINQVETKDARFQGVGLLSFQRNIDDVKANRDLAQSIIQKQQMMDCFQSTTKPDTKNIIQASQVLSNHNEGKIKSSKTNMTEQKQEKEQEPLINNRKQKPIL